MKPRDVANDPTSSDYVVEDQVGHLLRRAHQRATAIFLAELGEKFAVTPTQYAALVTGRSYARKAGVEHDVINANPHEFVFIEIELKEKAQG